MFSSYPSFKTVFLIGSFVMTCAFAFLPSPVPMRSFDARALTTTYTTPAQHSMALRVVADPPMKGDEKRGDRSRDGTEDDGPWISSKNGGFIPNIRARLGLRDTSTPPRAKSTTTPKKATPSKIKEVLDIQQYKTEVADVRGQMVCVRFYAPWCKSCKSIEASFRRLPGDFPGIKFVEVPITKDNAYLHKGLGVPSLPFGHVYDPSVGLVEERKINKKVFGDFKQVLRNYVNRECPVTYDEDENCIPLW